MLMMKKRKLENGMADNIRFSLEPCSKTYLCDDIVSTILLKLPVKSLLRFTSVSKSWNSVIRSPTFIATYNKLIRCRYLLYTPRKPRLGSTFFTSADDERRSNIKMPKDSRWVVGSCEGLVCVQNIRSQVYLWNPLLQTYKIIPPSPSQGTTTSTNSCIEFGFGYSCNNNDHKVVKIIHTEGDSSEHNKVEIYSLKTNSWKSIDSAAPAMPHGCPSVYANGCINWRAINTSRITIMWFDIDKELFGEKKHLTITKYCEEECNCSSSSRSMWKREALAYENSIVLLYRLRDQLEVIFDGEILFRPICKNVTPWVKKDLRKSESFHVVCVSESLMLLGSSGCE